MNFHCFLFSLPFLNCLTKRCTVLKEFAAPHSEYNLKQMLISKYGLRADDDTVTLREIHDSVRHRMDNLEMQMESKFQGLEKLIKGLAK